MTSQVSRPLQSPAFARRRKGKVPLAWGVAPACRRLMWQYLGFSSLCQTWPPAWLAEVPVTDA